MKGEQSDEFDELVLHTIDLIYDDAYSMAGFTGIASGGGMQ